MRLKWNEPCSTKRKITGLLIQLGFFEGTRLPEWVELAQDDLSELNNIEAEERLKELQDQHAQLMRMYNDRWLSIIKPFKN